VNYDLDFFEELYNTSTIESLRPLPKFTLKCLHEKILLEQIYNSNAIESNTLTVNETKFLLECIKSWHITIFWSVEA